MCTIHRDTYLYVNVFFFMTILQSVLDHHLFLYTKCLHTGLMMPNFLSLENPLSDSYMFICTLTRLTTCMYMYYSRLLVYDIVNVFL